MRRILAFNHVSADGYFAAPDGGLGWVVQDPELDRSIMADADRQAAMGSGPDPGTILFGRRTYEQFESFWPHEFWDPPEDFYRLFLVPGMAHCGGGAGANSFGNGGSGAATGRDPERDIFSALERWVERGVAPERVVGTGRATDDPSKPLTRPLCPYPQVAQYRGSGDVNDAANFACAAPSSR